MRYRLKQDPHNGLLNLKAPWSLPGYRRYFASDPLAPFVEHYWIIEWQLREPVLRETLPYPSAHIILEPGVALVAGVVTKKFSRLLEGNGRVLGTKFHVGGLRPFVKRPVSAFTDRTVPLSEVFGNVANDLDVRALAHSDHHAAISVVEAFLLDLHPLADEALTLVKSIAERIARDREILKVDQLVDEFRVGIRTLQRLFGEHTGVSPKWMIRRHRLQEAAERIASAEALDWAQMALDLGYSDQAHFSRDFKTIVGKSPASYLRSMSELPIA